jgi:hypothetical protein
MTTDLDPRDAQLLADRITTRNTLDGARVGDFVRMPDDTLRRFTYDWGDSLQVTLPNAGGSFYFSRSGHMDFSGGLDHSILRDRLHDTGETMPACAWFFHHDHASAHNGVNVMVPCRVFEYR